MNIPFRIAYAKAMRETYQKECELCEYENVSTSEARHKEKYWSNVHSYWKKKYGK